MKLLDIRNVYATEYPANSETARGMIKLINNLLAVQYDELFSLGEKFPQFEMDIPERSGRVTIVYDPRTEPHKYLLWAHALDQQLIHSKKAWSEDEKGNLLIPWKLVAEGSIRNLENPIRELDEFVERIRPLLPVAWK